MTDREKLIELLKEADRKAYETVESRPLSHPFEVWEIEADHLIVNGVTFATDNNVGGEWIPVTERLPQNFVSVLGYMTDAGDFPPVRECYTVGNAFYFPALSDVHPVSHWCEMPEPPKGE